MKLPPHTTIINEPSGTSLILYSTKILLFLFDGTIRLNSGGHRTSTTKRRLNQFLPPPLQICQSNFDWYLNNEKGEKGAPFEDNMQIPDPRPSSLWGTLPPLN